jgi:outer membrane protein assembly factor BamB
MIRSKGLTALALLALMPALSAAQSKKPLVDPFPLRFPLVEAGSIEFEGHIAGQPRARNGIVYFATREGDLTALVASSRSILWRFKAGHPVSTSPELAGEAVLLRDDRGVFYEVAGPLGETVGTKLDFAVSTPIRIIEGRVLLGTDDGQVVALGSDGKQLWAYRPSLPGAKVTAGPVPIYGRNGGLDAVLFGRADGRLLAVDPKGGLVWEFKAEGAIPADPAAAGGRVYFGTSDRLFYCLEAASGKRKWRRRLQGAPVHPAVIGDRTLAVPASNSVIYLLSRRGGSILSWEAIPSRVIYELAAAGRLALVSSAAPAIVALDLKAKKRAGQYESSGPLVAGAVWSPPYVVLFVEDEDSGRQRMVFLRSR